MVVVSICGPGMDGGPVFRRPSPWDTWDFLTFSDSVVFLLIRLMHTLCFLKKHNNDFVLSTWSGLCERETLSTDGGETDGA